MKTVKVVMIRKDRKRDEDACTMIDAGAGALVIFDAETGTLILKGPKANITYTKVHGVHAESYDLGEP